MHTPVLTDKVLEYLDPKSNENFVDCTAGGGGHTMAILERTAPNGKVLAIDWDTEAITILKKEIQLRQPADHNRIILKNENFAHVKKIIQEEKFSPIAGILLDLGFSSDQLNRERGLSFLKDEALDMRYSQNNPITAEKLINFSSRRELEQIFTEYGEEQFAGQIAKAIVEQRKIKPITKTLQLVRIIQETAPRSSQKKKIHAATQVFQALRIAVNDELENIRQGLRGAKDILPPGATPSLEEIKTNPRARSAKLRVATKL
jgi:16S rRNA (cytosine1402-N4)-methyltransferase